MNSSDKNIYQDINNKFPFIHYNLFSGDLSKLDLNSNLVINTLNPHSFCEAEKDSSFKEALQNSSILLPDGIGIVLAHNFFSKNKIHKIAGMDLFYKLINSALVSSDENHKRIFFLGSTPHTLQRISERFSIEYPELKMECYSPPFKNEFSEAENAFMFQRLAQFRPHILFVGMTAPKQEKWVFKNKQTINAKIICSIGAVFDFYAGTVKRPNFFWIDLGLEWLARFVNEPKRLWKRNLISAPKFVAKVLQYKFKSIFS